MLGFLLRNNGNYHIILIVISDCINCFGTSLAFLILVLCYKNYKHIMFDNVRFVTFLEKNIFFRDKRKKALTLIVSVIAVTTMYIYRKMQRVYAYHFSFHFHTFFFTDK